MEPRKQAFNEHIVTDIELTVINDGDGDQCGYSYHDRCEAVSGRYSPPTSAWTFFRDCTLNYEGQRLRAGCPMATAEDLDEAASRLLAYYIEHVAEDTE